MPKPVRWVERLATILKSDQIHESLIKKEGFESYVGNQLWTLSPDEASLRYHDGCFISWLAYETILGDLETYGDDVAKFY
jgi:hypothetical protein